MKSYITLQCQTEGCNNHYHGQIKRNAREFQDIKWTIHGTDKFYAERINANTVVITCTKCNTGTTMTL